MLNANDPQTLISLRQLGDIVKAGTRPVVFWIGAGSSRWLGFPSWKDLALGIRKDFYRNVIGFENQEVLELINKDDFPGVFQRCKDLDQSRYHRFLVGTFRPQPTTELYGRFVRLISRISPLFILTTNVDESLEGHLPMSATVQRSDLSLCVDLLQKRQPFTAKIHGSISSVASTVFTTADYLFLASDSVYLQTLKYIFAECTVVFLGYGVRDAYVVRLLAEDVSEKSLFGPGPHFVVTNDANNISSLKRIQYQIRLNPDHAAALSILDFIHQSSASSETSNVSASREKQSDCALAVPAGKTAYYISDFVPPGTWSTSQEIVAERGTHVIEASVGLGFTNDEVPFPISTALHDLVVGLICFDYIYLPFAALGAVHNSVGSELFWELVQFDVLRFVHNDAQISVLFFKGELIGNVANLRGGTSSGPEPAPVSALIRRVLMPAKNKEKEAERLFALLEQKTALYRRNVELDLPSLVRSALLMPDVSRLLGIGDAILPTQVPRWLRYPYLRLAHLVQTAALCNEYGIQATKLPFGGVHLTSAAFGVQAPELQADHLASYVSSGEYNSDLGALLHQNLSIIRDILRFRESAEGENFRKETAQVLANERGDEFNASVNAGLSRLIPIDILQKAKDRLLILMTERNKVTRVPAVWGSSAQSDTSTRFWRAKCQKMFVEMCATKGIGKNDPCICGSGEKMRLCCLPPLRQ